MLSPLLSSQQSHVAGSGLLELGHQAPMQSTRPTRMPTPMPAGDPGSPVAILASKGITENNKSDISSLATAMEAFMDFRHPGSNTYAFGKEGALQLIAITKLLQEAAMLHGDNWPISQNDFVLEIKDLKATIVSCSDPTSQGSGPTYAMVVRGSPGDSNDAAATPRQKVKAKM